MYKQFSYSNFIQTNERNHKLLFSKNSKLPPLIIKKTTQITNDVINKNKEKQNNFIKDYHIFQTNIY